MNLLNDSGLHHEKGCRNKQSTNISYREVTSVFQTFATIITGWNSARYNVKHDVYV